MHRLFVRAVMVFVLLFCAPTVHGWHADEATHPSGADPSALSQTLAAPDRATLTGDTVAARAASSAYDGHHPHGASCDTPSSINRSHSVVAPSLVNTTSPALPGNGDPPATDGPAVLSGRSLLLLRCVSRT